MEVRIGMPTLNPHKLKLWTRFLQYMAQDRSEIDTFDSFMQSNAPIDLKCYAVQRIKKFENSFINAGHPALANFDSYHTAIENLKNTTHDFTSGGLSV